MDFMKRIFLFISLLVLTFGVEAQRRVVQFSGLVVSGEESFGVPFAAIFVPKTSRGAYTNDMGFFSFPLLIGDTCMVRASGFKAQKYVIPDDGRESISVVLTMVADTSLLPEVEILPFPTEADFKRAFLSLKLPDTDMNRMRRNLNTNMLARMQQNLGFDAGLNHLYFQNQQISQATNQNFLPTTNQLINPFAWGRFLKDIKRERRMKKLREQDEE
jgi:hypothetical protein